VHPGLSVKIQAHTQTSEEKHSPMRISFLAAQDSARAADVAADGFVMEALAPSSSQHQSTQHSAAHSSAHSATAASKAQSLSLEQSREEKQEPASVPVGVLQQHLQNATAVAQKATSAAVQTLGLMGASLGLPANSSANASLIDNSPPMRVASDFSPDPVGSSQVHMGFNDTVVHDSFSSGDFSSVNSTDVVPISEMASTLEPSNMSESADWAQIIEAESSDDLSLPATSSSSLSSGSFPAADSYQSSSNGQDSVDLRGLSNVDKFIMEDDAQLAYDKAMRQSTQRLVHSASVSSDSSPEPSKAEELVSAWTSSESPSSEEASPEQQSPEAADGSEWVHVDPYGADLQGMIHPTSRIFRPPGK